MKDRKYTGVTIVELLVVLVIIGILSTISVNVYITRITRGRIAAARAEIHQMEVAIATYQVDCGEIPPSYSGTALSPESLDNDSDPYDTGCGYMVTALTRSLSGDMLNPLSSLWRGPYLNVPTKRIGTLDGMPLHMQTSTSDLESPERQFLDPWSTPYVYIRHQDYDGFGGTEIPATTNLGISETQYNANTYQIISRGPNGESLDVPERGLDYDDLTNFKNWETP